MLTNTATANVNPLETLLGAFQDVHKGSRLETSGWLLLELTPGAALNLTSELDSRVHAGGGVVTVGLWRQGLERPFGGLSDVVEDFAAKIQQEQPEILDRFGWTLVNLLYTWRRAHVPHPVGELRAGLADFVMRGDQHFIHQFFQKRKVTPQVLAHLTYYFLEAVSALGPVLLRLEGLEQADRLTWTALNLLQRYARHHRAPLLICGVARDVPGSCWRETLGADVGSEWNIIEISDESSNNREELLNLGQHLSMEEIEAASAASVFALPFRLRDWVGVLPEPLRPSIEKTLGRLLDLSVLRRVGEERFAFSNARMVEGLHSRLDAATQRSLHAKVFGGDEGEDPFAAAWHVALARLPQQGRHSFAAMERAWALSTYDCALVYAKRALATIDRQDEGEGAEQVDGNLLLAMLNYEAERYREADHYLLAALENPPSQPNADFLRYLLGYNAIFGLSEFERGAEILRPVLQYYESLGDERGAAYVRNSLAFALFRSRHSDEAIILEEINLQILANHELSDSFLLSILQLNLGRIYRNLGELEKALQLFRHALYVRKSELTPHVLLLFYATLGNFHALRGEGAASLDAYRHALELIRDMQIDGLKDQVLQGLTKGAPSLPLERVTRADEILFSLYFHLARACKMLSLEEEATYYIDAVRSQRGLFGEEAVRAFDAGLEAVSPLGFAHRPSEEVSNAEQFLQGGDSGLLHLMRVVASGDEWVSQAADILASGRSVALLLPHCLGSKAHVLESLVVYDPRDKSLAERMSCEVGSSYLSQGTAALVLEEFCGLFQELPPVPRVFQSASLKPQWRACIAGIVPLRACVQVLSPSIDGSLYEILQAFAARTGVGLLAAAPFHLWRNDLVATAEQGLAAFLVSSIGALVLGDRLIIKEQGEEAAANLLPFYPRLSEEALVFGGNSGEGRGSRDFLIRIKRRGGYATDDLLKLRAEVRPIVELCDGTLTVSEIVGRIGGFFPVADRLEEQVCSFLRTLWHRGALCFDPPTLWRNVA